MTFITFALVLIKKDREIVTTNFDEPCSRNRQKAVASKGPETWVQLEISIHLGGAIRDFRRVMWK